MNVYFLFHKDQLLLTTGAEVPRSETLPRVPVADGSLLKLPQWEGMPCYAGRLVAPPQSPDWMLMGLRETFGVLPDALFRLASKAHELLHWDDTTRFCGRCGAPMHLHTDISKRCTRCGDEVWPSLATAVIVAITRNNDEEILLVQSHKFKRDYMGLVAGFVETGETLEECVKREVWEETRLHIRNLRYFASQPWPFPNVLMVGFTAEYADGELTLQTSELKKGGWFRRDNMPDIPGKVSLARRLIDHWLNK